MRDKAPSAYRFVPSMLPLQKAHAYHAYTRHARLAKARRRPAARPPLLGRRAAHAAEARAHVSTRRAPCERP